jgi:pimeloyl-ACP methyl ester carboxylesterase
MSARIPLLLLPGLLTDERLFGPQLPALSGATRPIVADLAAGESMAELARGAIAQAPPGPFLVAGLSMGGYVALEVLRAAPGRVRGLALLNTNARADSAESTENRRRLMALAERDFEAVFQALLPRLLHPSRLQEAAITGLLRDMAHALGPQAFRRHQQAIIERIDSRPHLAAIECPTLVIAGREDAIMGLDAAEEIAAAVPGARLEVIERCGHVSTLEQPEAVTELLAQWITSATA